MDAEVKVDVDARDEGLLRAALRDAGGATTERRVAFYDTADRALWRAGVVLRVRTNGTKGDVTLKLRLAEPSLSPPGSKTEWDVTAESSVLHSSLGADVQPGQVDALWAGTVPLSALLAPAQRAALAVAAPTVDPGALQRFGPISSSVVKASAMPGFSGAVTLEVWALPAGAVVELSTRAQQRDVALVQGEMARALAVLGARLAAVQGGKTERALRLPPATVGGHGDTQNR